MAKVTDKNFLTIGGWMRTRLDLSGNELVVFAVIYQFSQGKAGRYIGGLPYLADWCGCHTDTARRALRNLEDRGLITAIRGEVNGVPYCNYIVCEESLQNARIPLQNTGETLANCEGDTRKMQGIILNELQDNYKKEGVDSNAHARFKIPSFEDVEAYCRARGNGIDPQQFVDYYTANGWRVGRKPMRDWQAAVRQWEQRRKNESSNQRPFPRQQKESVYQHNARALEEAQRRIQLMYADEQ